MKENEKPQDTDRSPDATDPHGSEGNSELDAPSSVTGGALAKKRVGDFAQSWPKSLRRMVRLLEWSVAGVVFALVIVVLALFMAPQGVRLPPWVAQKVEALILEKTPLGEISVEEMRIGLDDHFNFVTTFNTVRLSDIEKINAIQLDQVMVISDATSQLFMETDILELHAQGLFAKLLRDQKGDWNWSFGARAPSSRAIPDFATIDTQFEALLSQNPFSNLQNMTVGDVFLEIQDQTSERLFTTDAGRLELGRKVNEDQSTDITVDFDIAILSDQGGASYAQFRFASPVGTRQSQMSLAVDDAALADIAQFEPSLAWLAPFAANATANLGVSTDAEGSFAPVNLQIEFTGGQVAFAGFGQRQIEKVKTYLKYIPDSGEVIVDDFSVKTDLLEMSVNGRLLVEPAGLDQKGSVSGHFSTTSFNILELENDVVAGLSIPAMRGNFKSSLDGQDIQLGAVEVVMDAETKIYARGRFSDGLAALDATAQNLEHQQILKHWPENVQIKARKWVQERVLNAVVENAALSVRHNQKTKENDILLTADLDESSIIFSKKFPVLHADRARLTIENELLHVRADQVYSKVDKERMFAQNVTFQIDDIKRKPNFGTAELSLKAPVARLIKYLEQTPTRPLSRFNLPPQKIEGMVEGRLTVRAPLKPPPVKFPELEIKAEGKITQLSTPTLVKNHKVGGKSLALQLDGSGLRLKGPAFFDGFDGQANLWLPFDKSGMPDLKFSAFVDEQDLAQLGVRLGFLNLNGQTKINGQLEMTKKRPWTLKIDSDLSGLAMKVPAAPWSKPASQKGAMSVDVALSKPLAVPTLKIKANGLEADLSVKMNASGKLDETRIQSLKIGSWLDVEGTVSVKDAVSQIQLVSGRVDFEGRPKSLNPQNSRANFPFRLRGKLDEFRYNERIVLRGLNLESLRADKSFGLTARMGDASVQGKIDNLGRRIVLMSSDAGKVFDAAKVSGNIVGGNLQLDLRQNSARNGYEGKALINDFRVVEMPIFAQLLSAISVVGLLEQLDKEGIQFNELDASFSFDPDHIRLNNSSAYGASIGLSARGDYDPNSKKYLFDGVISPLYLLNVVGAPISRKGEGLLGITFAIEGMEKKSKVTVNPLSMLLPGPLRELLRKTK